MPWQEIDYRRLTRAKPALRHNDRGSDAFTPRRRKQDGLRVQTFPDSEPGRNVIGAAGGGIIRVPDLINLHDAQLGYGIDESGCHDFAGRIDTLGVCRHVNLIADGDDYAIAD